MVAFKTDVKEIVKEEIPTARFWLMLKMKFGWNKRWDIYTSHLEKSLLNEMVGDDIMAKKVMVKSVIEKVEKSAWNTMPPEFLKSIKVDRLLRH
jgi:hypothetical protein